MKPKTLALAVVVSTFASWTVASSGAIGGSGDGASPEGAAARAAGAWRTFTSPVDGGTTYRLSRRGNVYSAESPTGIDHIDSGTPIEGYCLRYTPDGLSSIEAYDVSDTQSGFGKAKRSRSAPWKVTRLTTDGRLQLTQAFTFDGLAKELQVKMTLKNVSRRPMVSIHLSRVVDFEVDVGGTGGFSNPADNWLALTQDSLLAWSDAAVYTVPHGMMLQILRKPSTSGGAAFFDNSPTTCAAGLFAQGPHKGDDTGGIQVGIGGLEPGAKRSVIFRYTRY